MLSHLVRDPTFGSYGTRIFCVCEVANPLRVVTISGKVNWQAAILIYLSENYSPVRHHGVSLPLAYSRYFRDLSQNLIGTMKVPGCLRLLIIFAIQNFETNIRFFEHILSQPLDRTFRPLKSKIFLFNIYKASEESKLTGLEVPLRISIDLK